MFCIQPINQSINQSINLYYATKGIDEAEKTTIQNKIRVQ